MKNLIFIFFILLFVSSIHSKPVSEIKGNWNYKISNNSLKNSFPFQQVLLSANNISSFFMNAGIFNQDRRTSNTPGFEWPYNSHKFACFSAGLSIGTKIDGVLTEASGSYKGEFAPGYINNSTGTPVAVTNSDFKIYIVNINDNSSNPDYANWYKMVPYGAPYIDVNNNGIYDNAIDKPGVKNARTTLFACLTDGFPENHSASEGFGGGTAPIFCEMHWSAWAYYTIELQDIQFVKWEIVNKNVKSWDSTYIGVVTDPDLGDGYDDYIGCDTTLNLGYCYNADNIDGDGNNGTYGWNPPAFGIDLLKGPVNKSITPPVSIGLTSFNYFSNPSSAPIACERDPNPNIPGAYNYLRGVKLDGTSWVNPLNMQATKFCYPGDPETDTGWLESKGSVKNCNGSLTGTVLAVNPAGDRRFVMSSGAGNFKIQSNEIQNIVIAQMVARGANCFNSVTLLKQLDMSAQNYFNVSLPVDNIQSETPSLFSLYQNYPNPFNPSTNIKFDMTRSGSVTLKIYDASGKEVSVLINSEQVQAGTNEVIFDAKNMASGIYFYTLSAGTFTDTKRMILIK